VVKGDLNIKGGVLVDYLLKDKEKNIVKVVPETMPGGRKAVLRYTVIENADKLSLVMINLETGRPHQIRVQLSNLGYPILGDKKYGGGKNSGYSDTLSLWSHILEFKHPVKNEIIRITSNPPDCYPWNLFSKLSDLSIYESLITESVKNENFPEDI